MTTYVENVKLIEQNKLLMYKIMISCFRFLINMFVRTRHNFRLRLRRLLHTERLL